jgi:DNA-binding PadR family transcriptional regulator
MISKDQRGLHMLDPAKVEELKKLTEVAEEVKFKLLAQGAINVLHVVNVIGPTSASQLTVALTIAKGKMMSLTQIAPILKDLVQWHCLTIKDTISDHTGRSMNLYTLTKKGEHILDLCVQLIHTMMKKK